MTPCPVCARSWRDLDRHLAFAHGETTLAWIEQAAEAADRDDGSPRGLRVTNGGDRFTPPSAAAEPVWLPAAFALLSLAGLWLVVAS